MSDPLSSEPPPSTAADLLSEADALKAEANDHFRAGRWEEAIALYRSALGRLPKRPVQKTKLDEDDAIPDPLEAKDDVKKSEPEAPIPEAEGVPKARAVLNANLAACHLKLGDHQAVVDACTEALKDDENYVKALQRRASSSEALNTWSSLSTAQADLEKLSTLAPSPAIDRTLRSLRPRVEAAQKRETAEMMDKFKSLGNSLLGNFGLSTDNFKFEPNGSGGYSLNFGR